MITLITATGGRHKAFALCEKYMHRQTFLRDKMLDDIQWIVIDDFSVPTEVTLGQEYFRGPKDWREGLNTQRLNMDYAIPLIQGERVFVIEDDDWYHPDYLAMMNSLLDYVPIVGEANAHYYHIESSSYKDMLNFQHASLCSTAFRKELIPMFEEAVNSGELWFDITLWRYVQKKRVPHILTCPSIPFCVGIKGMPGRFGIGTGHKPTGFTMDTSNFGKLREWIGDADVELYKEFLPKDMDARSLWAKALRNLEVDK